MKVQDQNNSKTQGCLQWFLFKIWLPLDSKRNVMIASGIVGIFFLILAITTLAIYCSGKQLSAFYAQSGHCITKSNDLKCSQIIRVDEDLSPPILFMYVIHDAYMNHRGYIDSFSPQQLGGSTIDMPTAQAQCSRLDHPFISNANMGVSHSYTGSPLDPDAISSPCGLKPHLFFNDTYKLYKKNKQEVQINQNGVELAQNQWGFYQKQPGSTSTQWINPEDGHFINYMETQAGLTKYKLWGTINEALPAGDYEVVADNNFKIGEMTFTKGIQLVQPSALGGKIFFFPIIFFVMSLISFAYIALLKWKIKD